MIRWMAFAGAVATCLVGLPSRPYAAEPTATQRGEKALVERSFNPPTISFKTYKNVWRLWGERKEAPAAYAEPPDPSWLGGTPTRP